MIETSGAGASSGGAIDKAFPDGLSCRRALQGFLCAGAHISTTADFAGGRLSSPFKSIFVRCLAPAVALSAWVPPACAIVLCLHAPPSLAREQGPPPILRALIVKYRCPIYDRLVRIHDAGNPLVSSNRFIAITLPDGHYVQCKFHDRTLKLYCEVASGFYETAPGRQRTTYLSPASLRALTRLGFSTDDSHGNFSADLEIGSTPDYTYLADFLLTTLLVAYDARADMELRIEAPFAPRPSSTCDPTS